MKLITALFGKTSDITKKDIEEKIIKPRVKENLTLEYKEIINLGYTQKEGQIIKPLIGFLNTTKGNGLLILGIRDKLPTEIKPIDQTLIKNEEQLRAIITSSIILVPRTREFPKLTIVSVPVNENSNLFLIEIETINEYYTYSSLTSGCVYLRRNDETLLLSLHETLELISKKRFPKVFVYFDERPIETENRVIFTSRFKNEGLEPSRYVAALIQFFYEGNLDITLEGEDIQDVSEINLYSKKTYQVTAAYPPQLLLYPNKTTIFGKLKISPKKNFELKAFIETFENKGFTTQQILISNNNGNVSVQNLSASFTPYLRI